MNKINLFSKQSFLLWFSATTYAITAGIFIPRIVDIVLTGRLPFTITVMVGPISIIREIFMFISPLIGIWIGVFLSAKYLFRQQIARGGKVFIKIATGLLLIIFLAIQILFSYGNTYEDLSGLISIIISIIIFYFLSKKYVQRYSSKQMPGEIEKTEKQDYSLAKQPKYMRKVFFFGRDISFLVILVLNLILVFGALFLLPSVFTSQNYPASGWMSVVEASDYVSAQKVAFLIALGLSFIFLLFFNIKRVRGRGLLNLLCLFLILFVVEFVFMGLISSPYECYSGIYIQPKAVVCIRTIDYIPTIFLFLPLIYAVADVINREKGRKITTKRVITLFLGMLFF
ncbi:hypothetical protein KKC63_01490, partial [Patescibacteria group bacterium]|nr:hypothetical protein [Patescibacteria group bacterium]